jgi:hypothetical protein
MRQTHYGLDAGLSDNTVYHMAQRDTFLVGAFLALSAIFLVMRITAKNNLEKTASKHGSGKTVPKVSTSCGEITGRRSMKNSPITKGRKER